MTIRYIQLFKSICFQITDVGEKKAEQCEERLLKEIGPWEEREKNPTENMGSWGRPSVSK